MIGGVVSKSVHSESSKGAYLLGVSKRLGVTLPVDCVGCAAGGACSLVCATIFSCGVVSSAARASLRRSTDHFGSRSGSSTSQLLTLMVSSDAKRASSPYLYCVVEAEAFKLQACLAGLDFLDEKAASNRLRNSSDEYVWTCPL